MDVGKLLLCCVLVLILQTHFSWVESKMVVPSLPIIVPVGSDVTLPCHVDSVRDLRDLVVEWARPDLKPPYVHIRRDGLDLLIDQNSLYQGRTRLTERGLQYGDMSLQLSRARLSDGGTYRCFVPQMDTAAEVTLHVVSVSPVSLTLTKEHSGSPVLRCESRGWYPEPELDWLDSEGTVLTTGKTEVQRGVSDETFSVSSRVSVEQSHETSFTCRVKQPESRQSREAHINITDDLLEGCASCAVAWTLFGLVLCLIAAALVLWKYKTHKSGRAVVNEEQREESEVMLKPAVKEQSDEQKLNVYKEACLRIAEEIRSIEEYEKGLTSKEFLLTLKEVLHRCNYNLEADTEVIRGKMNASNTFTSKDKNKERQDKIRKNESQMTTFRNILDHTEKEIARYDDILLKTTERKGKLKAEYELTNKLLEDEKKRLAAAVQPEILQVSEDDEVKVRVVDESVISDLCADFGNAHIGAQTHETSEEQSQTDEVKEEEAEKKEAKEPEFTAEAPHDPPVKTDKWSHTKPLKNMRFFK